MFNGHAFDYINIVDRAADASYLRETMIMNNIANNDTPNYKRQDLEFQSVLERALRDTRYKTMAEAVGSVDLKRLEGREFTDAANFSYRIDKNNVDIDTENVELASEQLRYQTEMQSITMDFTRLKTVIK